MDSTCHQIGEYASGNIYIRPVRLEKAGDQIKGDKHNFDHTTFVTKGAVNVVAMEHNQRIEQDFEAGEHFLVRKNWQHTITALRNNTEFACIYSHRNPQGEVVQEFTGWLEAYAAIR